MGNALHDARIVFVSPPSTIDDVHRVLAELWSQVPQVSASDKFSFETAVIELSSNVIRHADDGNGVSCELRVACDGDTLTADLKDSGMAGEVYLANPPMPDAFAEAGRGLPIIHALVHAVTYERIEGLNRWHLMRRLDVERQERSERGYE